MPTSQQHISPSTPTGATLFAGGATFRAWAPRATAVYALSDGNDAVGAWRDEFSNGYVVRWTIHFPQQGADRVGGRPLPRRRKGGGRLRRERVRSHPDGVNLAWPG